MATLLSEKVPPSHPFDSIAVDIETRYERIVNVVRERKEILLKRLSEFREEYDSLLSSRDRTERELERTKEYIETIKENDLKTMQQEILAKIEEKMQKLQISIYNYFIQFECESEELENKLSRLGELVKTDYKLPNYSEMVAPVVVVGKKEKYDFNLPRGIVFDEETQLIYVCDMGNSCVKIISIRGDFISEFGRNELDRPWGIFLCKDSIYVTDWIQWSIFQFHPDTHQLIKKAGRKGSGKGAFNTPMSLAVGPDGELYVAEDHNKRISVLDRHLNFQRFIQHQLILSPVDVKFTNNSMLILSKKASNRVHLLTLQGEYLKPIIIIEPVDRSLFFCLDRANNIVVGIQSKALVQVFSEQGELLHYIGTGLSDCPYGLTTTRSGRLIVVSDHGLQIF